MSTLQFLARELTVVVDIDGVEDRADLVRVGASWVRVGVRVGLGLGSGWG